VSEERSLSVSEAMALAKRALESVRLRVVGEVSEFNDKPGYRAAYFTVCDDSSAMPCLMWRDAYEASGVALRCGMQSSSVATSRHTLRRAACSSWCGNSSQPGKAA